MYSKNMFENTASKVSVKILEFLTCFTDNKLTPHFLGFKLYSDRIRGNEDYSEFQRQLLNNEIQCKIEIQDSRSILQLDHRCALEIYSTVMTSIDFQLCNQLH